MRFKNRHESGIKLAEKLEKYKNSNAIVLAIPRGGVEVGYEIAKHLKINLDIIVTKKIGLEGNDEFAIGSVGPDKKVILNKDIVKSYNVSKQYLDTESKRIGEEIERRYKEYKGQYKLSNLKGKVVILTDDGIATGHTVKAALEYIKRQNPEKIIIAVPVSPSGFAAEIKDEADEFICLHSAENFYAVGQFYEEFEQLSDSDVKNLLKGE
ncbi:MAG: phosphoribosyltransferase [Nanoarchaeota archaeon]